MWDLIHHAADGTEVGLNTLFVRYGCGTLGDYRMRRWRMVLIPYSSGMGVGPCGRPFKAFYASLNTLFVRYGCGTAADLYAAWAYGS